MSEQNEFYTLREVSRELDLSEIWVRRMLTKEVGILGGKGAKVDGKWRIPAEVVERLRKQYEDKRETTLRRKLGEIPKYEYQYVPDRIKACRIVPDLLREYQNDLTEMEMVKVEKILKKIEKDETKKYKARKKERSSKKQEEPASK